MAVELMILGKQGSGPVLNLGMFQLQFVNSSVSLSLAFQTNSSVIVLVKHSTPV